MFSSEVVIENILTGEIAMRPFHDLGLGFGTFEAGKYYCIYGPLVYYYCDWVNDEEAKLYVVESFQFGELLQAELIVPVEEQGRYLPVDDKEVLSRLTVRLERLKARV